VLLTGGEALRGYPIRDLPLRFANHYCHSEPTVAAISCTVSPTTWTSAGRLEKLSPMSVSTCSTAWGRRSGCPTPRTTRP
jgi:hypothetical protein